MTAATADTGAVLGGRANTIELVISGMTCASCVSRVERNLNAIEGVDASVNLALAKALVRYADDVSPDDLIAAVHTTGYTASPLVTPPLIEPVEIAGSRQAGPADSAPLIEPVEIKRPGDPLRRRLVVSAALTVPVVAMSMVMPWQFSGWQWVSLVLATPVVTWGAWPFHRATWINARHRATTMDTLVTVGVLAAYGWSLYALFLGDAGAPGMQAPFGWIPEQSGGGSDIYLEVATGVTTLILAGRYLEARATRRAGSAIRALLSLSASEVEVLRRSPSGPVETRIPIDQLTVGDLFLVRPGEKVATDGEVVEGSSAVDNSLITGEPVPIDVGPGTGVVGGSLNTWGRLVVRANRVGADTSLAQMVRLVEQAQHGKAPVQRLVDRVSAVFVPAVMVAALATLLGWLVSGSAVELAFSAAVAVLIIACPCALGLATPTALMVGVGRGAQLGIIIKGPAVLESTRRVDTVLLDKTGTVTEGRLSLAGVLPTASTTPHQLLRMAAAVEAGSEHPVGRAVTSAGRAAGMLPIVAEFASAGGLGVSGLVDGRRVSVGRRTWVVETHACVDDGSLARAAAHAASIGSTPIWVGWDGHVRGIFVLDDVVKPTSTEAVTSLRQQGLHPILVTGDNMPAALHVAAAVGIESTDVIADVLPEGKLDTVRELQAGGRVVAMVGDGINDAAALAAADLGLSLGTGTDVAMEASDLTLVRGDLRSAADAITLSRATLRTIKGNLFWAFAYNVAAIPIAAAGLLNPMFAAAAMAMSSLFVVGNSLRLRRFQPPAGARAHLR